MKKAVCIHAHFYQPPRENPWLEAVEVQDSAHPFHDWNERITVECYAPNGAARLQDAQGRILRIVNNYSRISFNFGPTLLAWLERHSPEAYRRILEGDQESCKRFGGHGNALAMPYNHIIMPLASPRDRETQVVWGIEEFRRHFGRPPEGMWLPEAAVDIPTLDALARHGIRFTILSPFQAKRVWLADEKKSVDVTGGRIDPRRPYLCALPEGRSIVLFFYDSPIAHAVAFEHLLANGDGFAQRLKSALDAKPAEPQLSHIATDGESYGHHWRHGDMALAAALANIENDPAVELTNYGRYLELNPPKWNVEIYEKTSWSCAHGVERWRSDCGCKLDPGRGWHQRWRTPLREALDWLRDETGALFEKRAAALVKSPWQARNAYIRVVGRRTAEALNEFCSAHQTHPLTPSESVEMLKLFEMQRHAMLMFTSCAWFFDEISGLEAVQNLKFACRAIQLADDLGVSLEEGFVARLERAESNLPEFKNGAGVWHRLVKPALTPIRRAAAHAAMESAFDNRLDEHALFCYDIVPRRFHRATNGASSLTVGRLEARSRITQEADDVTFAVLAFGGHDVQCSMRASSGVANFDALQNDLLAVYAGGGLADVVRALDRHFGTGSFTLKDLFLETRRRILADMTQDKLQAYEGVFRSLYEENQRLMEFVREADAPVPRAFLAAAECILNRDLAGAIAEFLDKGETERLSAIVAQARRWNVPLQLSEYEPRLRAHLNSRLKRLIELPDEAVARETIELIRKIRQLQLPLYFWEAQNLFVTLSQNMAAGGPMEEMIHTLRTELGFA
ncbi:MAG: DUF3536 domain-containing protein [Candidatus Sumerlaeia bacterium]|nr:DUF3536 domain-containing protein [Candidatus Sumerlaeia bacterium]